MKQILFPTILVLVFCFQMFGQENADCPTINVVPPSKVSSEWTMLFSVSVKGNFDHSKLEYKWTISSGEILDGQQTPAILVKIIQEGQTVKANVKIKGLPDHCQNTFSNQIDTPPPLQCRCLDEYPKIAWPDEKSRLQNGMMVELTADLKAMGYIIFHIKNDADLDSVMIRQKKILKFLESSKIPSSRIVMKIEKSEDYLTKIRILPEGAKLPE